MPYFLTQQDAYRLIQRLLPGFVFPDGAPSTFFWTAEAFSYALNVQSAYQNASGIYQNFFPQTCDATAISSWEVKCFGSVNPQGATGLAQRQAAVVQYLQTSAPGISTPAMVSVIERTIPGLVSGVNFEIAAWCCGQGEGGWVLDESQLDLETYLNYSTQFALVNGSGPGMCATAANNFQPWVAWGLSQQDWINLQTFAYTYSVILTTTLTPMQLVILNAALTIYGPARSQFVIVNGSTDPLPGNPLC